MYSVDVVAVVVGIHIHRSHNQWGCMRSLWMARWCACVVVVGAVVVGVFCEIVVVALVLVVA